MLNAAYLGNCTVIFGRQPAGFSCLGKIQPMSCADLLVPRIQFYWTCTPLPCLSFTKTVSAEETPAAQIRVCLGRPGWEVCTASCDGMDPGCNKRQKLFKPKLIIQKTQLQREVLQLEHKALGNTVLVNMLCVKQHFLQTAGLILILISLVFKWTFCCEFQEFKMFVAEVIRKLKYNTFS